jgi:hypothetical protein
MLFKKIKEIEKRVINLEKQIQEQPDTKNIINQEINWYPRNPYETPNGEEV